MWKRVFRSFSVLGFFLCYWVIQGAAQAQTSSALTLEEAVLIALKQNPELKAMEQEVQAAQAKIPQAKGWDDPQVGVRFYQVPFRGGLEDASDIDYLASQKISFPGKKKAAGQIAYHEYLHHVENLNAQGRKLLREVKTAYVKLFVVERQLAQLTKAEKLLKGSIEAAQASVAANQSLAMNAVQGQTELSRLLIERQSLLEQRKILEAELMRLLAYPHPEPIRLSSQFKIPVWNPSLESLIEIAQNRHSSLKLAQHNVGQKQWQVKAARREYYPDFSVQLEYVQRPGGNPDAWTGELMLNVPLQVKKKKGAVQQAQAELAQAQYTQLSAQNNVVTRVRQLHTQLASAQKILQLYQGSLLPQARQAYEMTSQAYAIGQVQLPALFSAERTFLEAQSNYWKAYESRAVVLFELEEAIGATQEELTGSSAKIQQELSRRNSSAKQEGDL